MAGKPLVKRDRRYRSGYRVTAHGHRVMLASATGFVIWVVLLIAAPTLGAWFTLAAFVYIVGRVAIKLHDRFGRPAAPPPARYLPPSAAAYLPPPRLAYPPAQPFQPAQPLGERNSRVIPQDVKIAAAARDGGRCRQCGSTADLHFDHVIPWSKGGANTLGNIQLLCGTCNRRKGADDIPLQLAWPPSGASTRPGRHAAPPG